MKKTYAIADLKAGGKIVRHVDCATNQLSGNLRSNEIAIEGEVDPLTQRYDAEAGSIASWNDPDAARIEMEPHRSSVQARIQFLEGKLSRIFREIELTPDAVGDDGKTPRQRLEEIDQQINSMRAEL